MNAYQIFMRYMGVRSCWQETQDPAGQLCEIFVGLGRLGSIDVCYSFIGAWGTGILEVLALLRALSWCGHAFQ